MKGSQQDFVGNRTTAGALLQENFAKNIVKWFGLQDPLAALFKRMGPSRYKISGKKLVITAESKRAGMAMATGGQLPSHQEVAPVQLETTPARRYVRSALDNFIAALTRGPGAAEDYTKRLNRQHLERFEEMERRHIHGSSNATICVASVRNSATSITVKNGLGYVGQPPLAYLDEGMWGTWLDASNNFAVLGAGVIAPGGINYATNTITFSTAVDNGTVLIADGDVFVASTTPNVAADFFVPERGYAPMGLLDIIDPKATNSSFMGLSETTNPRWKPLRRTSVTFDDMEFTDFTRQLAAKSTSPVTPQTHTMSTQPGIITALAAALTAAGNMQFTQTKGKVLNGGWTTVNIAGHDFVESPDHIFDTIYAHCMEDYHRVHLGAEFADVAEDGSMYSRLPDFDGKEWYGRDYMQQFADRRNRLGALTGIANANAARYTSTPA